jgi:hypothetical protein
VTSGTSYSKKQLPVTQRQKTNFFFKGIAPLFDVLFTHFPQARGLQKSLKIMFQPTYSTSPGGIKVQPPHLLTTHTTRHTTHDTHHTHHTHDTRHTTHTRTLFTTMLMAAAGGGQ